MPSANPRRPRSAPRPDKVLQYVLSSPWAISEQGLHMVMAVASRLTISPEALEQQAGRPLDNTRETSVRDRIATIPVRGPLVKRASWFDAVSGATDYESLARDIATAVADTGVDAIILAFDTPGGEVAGCSELAQQIRAARSEKPIHAYISGDGCSAGYWLASSCTRIWVANTSLTGCLGCRMTMVDDTAAMERAGIERIEIVSSQTPNKSIDPSTSEGKGRVLAILNDLAAVFFADVAIGRGVSADTVIAEYGGGDVFVGEAAVARGLADGVTTYEALHASLRADARRAPTPSTEDVMSTPKTGARRGGAIAAAAALAAAVKAEAFATDTEVRSLVTRDVGIAEGDICVIAEMREGVFYGVAIGDARYLWMHESELAAAAAEDAPEDTPPEGGQDDPADDEEETTAVRPAQRIAARIATKAAAAENARVRGILGYAPRFGLDALAPFLADPSCTREQAAAALLDRGPAAATRRLTALRADDAAVAASGLSATTVPPKNDDKPTAQRMLQNYARVNPDAVPDSVKAGSPSK